LQIVQSVVRRAVSSGVSAHLTCLQESFGAMSLDSPLPLPQPAGGKQTTSRLR
jgi:hypothetical protein